jgi:flagellin-like hook-associated protein FlgL
MAINSVNFTRVSNNLQALSVLDSLRRNTLALFNEQNRLASGNRLNSPSDDPVAASRILNLSEILDGQDQVLANIKYADAFLTATDNGMSETSDLVTQAKTIASDMVNTTVLPDERESEAEVVRSIIDSLVAVGNRTYNGVYIFGGKNTTSPPFAQKYGGVAYVGDTTDLTTDIGGPENAVINLTGNALFGMTTGRILGYQNLEPAPLADTRLADLKGATSLGVRLAQFQVQVNGGATSFMVDVTGAATLGDVVDAVNNAWQDAGGAGNLASISGTGLRLDTAGAGSIEVRESGNGTIAADLGILKSDAGGVIAGDNLHARITKTTPVTALVGGAGIALGSILIANGTGSAVVDLSGAQTVQDILNAINSADVGAHAAINDSADGINVTNLVSGTELRISGQGGDTADRLGILSLHTTGKLSDLNHGRGVRCVAGKPDFRITSMDGIHQVDVSISGATTVQGVLDAINSAAAAAGADIQAVLNPTGPGIRINDTSGGGGTLRIDRLNSSFAIDDLGLNKSADPGQTYLVSDDVAGVRAASLFSALLDLEAGLRNDDTTAINNAAQELEAYVPNMIRLRGIVGARSKAMHDRVSFTEDAVQATKAMLSDLKDLDYTEAVTKFQQAQTALQANLLTGSRMLSISLLDFLK